jgi:hypothetical protein
MAALRAADRVVMEVRVCCDAVGVSLTGRVVVQVARRRTAWSLLTECRACVDAMGIADSKFHGNVNTFLNRILGLPVRDTPV